VVNVNAVQHRSRKEQAVFERFATHGHQIRLGGTLCCGKLCCAVIYSHFILLTALAVMVGQQEDL